MEREMQIKALASETRLKILKLLADPAREFSDQWSADPVEIGVCMTLIAEALGVAQPTVSRHMDILRRAGFVTIKRHQKWSYCQQQPTAITEYLQWLGRELSLDN